jgi:hypothetical protein
MKVLNFIRISLSLMYYTVAMREINPLHKDVPAILVRQRDLQDQLANLWR